MSRTFSFLDVQVTLAGPGGVINLGAGAGNSEDGITFEYTEDADIMKIGADGSPMHSLNASKAGKATVRLQKTSPVNQLLQNMINFQRLSSLNWGKNVISLRDSARGDAYAATSVAFVKTPSNTYAKEAGVLEWEFNVGYMDAALGAAE